MTANITAEIQNTDHAPPALPMCHYISYKHKKIMNVLLKESEQKEDVLQITVHFKNSKVPSHKREEQ
jgi:hypothetical protein